MRSSASDTGYGRRGQSHALRDHSALTTTMCECGRGGVYQDGLCLRCLREMGKDLAKDMGKDLLEPDSLADKGFSRDKTGKAGPEVPRKTAAAGGKQVPACKACGRPALTRAGKVMKNRLCSECHREAINRGRAARKACKPARKAGKTSQQGCSLENGGSGKGTGKKGGSVPGFDTGFFGQARAF